METEAALCGSANSFILEKVLQEVKEVENREHRDENETEATVEDLKFRPGFVHLLKDRFALLSVKSQSLESTEEDGPLKSSTSALDLAENASNRAIGGSRHLSKSTEQLDGRIQATSRHRGSLQSNHSNSPEKRSSRVNGSILSNAPVTSTAFVRLQPKEDVIGSANDGTTKKDHPSSIHLFPRSTDSKTLDRIRSAGNKVIIIESASSKPSSDNKKKQTLPSSKPKVSSDTISGSNENEPDAAWPVPNIVKSTRTLFEQNKRRAPSIPSNSNASINTSASPKIGKPSPPQSPEKSSATPTTPTQVLVHGQPIKVYQSHSSKTPGTVEKSSKPVENEKPPRKPPTPKQDSSDLRRNSGGSASKSLFLPAAPRVKNRPAPSRPSEVSVAEKDETVVSVSEAKLMFDKGSPQIGSRVSSKQKVESPKKVKAPHVFPKSSKLEDSQRESDDKTTTFSQSRVSHQKSPTTFAPTRQPAKQVTASADTRPAFRPSSSPTRVVASNSSETKANNVNNDPSAWQTWDDIPKPKRKSFVSEARRVDISQEQLSAARSKNKSFFFTVADSSKKSKLDDEPTNDRTVTINVPKVEEHNKVALPGSPSKEPSESRLAQQTFWDSYRNDEDEKSTNVDSELYGDFLKLMASAKASSNNELNNEKESNSILPSTNIDDIPNDTKEVAAVTMNGYIPTKQGIRVIDKKERKPKLKLSFAKDACLTSTYEYPSERTMIEKLGISPDFDLDGGGELSIDDPAALFGLDDLSEDDDESLKKSKLLSGKPGVTSGTLASYQPKYGGSEYTWGQDNSSQSSGSASRDLLDRGGLVSVDTKVAEDVKEEDEMNWSSAATADLLF